MYSSQGYQDVSHCIIMLDCFISRTLICDVISTLITRSQVHDKEHTDLTTGSVKTLLHALRTLKHSVSWKNITIWLGVASTSINNTTS